MCVTVIHALNLFSKFSKVIQNPLVDLGWLIRVWEILDPPLEPYWFIVRKDHCTLILHFW